MKRILEIVLFGCALFAWVSVPALSQDEKKEPAKAPPPSLPRAPQAAPTLPAPAPDVRQLGETGFWVGINLWFPKENPIFNKGRGATFDTPSLFTLQGTPKYAKGAEVGLAVGLHNQIRASYFELRASSNFTTNTALKVWERDYDSGTYLTTDYRIRSGTLSFDYLTWPYPVESRRFRLKTLWQVKYTAILTGTDAPNLPRFDDNGNILVDTTGQPISYAAKGEKWFISPAVGLGTSYYVGRYLRLDANASGWTWPRRNTVWDADATANMRFGHFELRVGAKGFHFKTSTKEDFYMRGTAASGFVGIRWYSQ